MREVSVGFLAIPQYALPRCTKYVPCDVQFNFYNRIVRQSTNIEIFRTFGLLVIMRIKQIRAVILY